MFYSDCSFSSNTLRLFSIDMLQCLFVCELHKSTKKLIGWKGNILALIGCSVLHAFDELISSTTEPKLKLDYFMKPLETKEIFMLIFNAALT